MVTPKAETPRWLGMPAIAWAVLILSLAVQGAVYLAVGATLGLFFGGIVFATLLVPTLCLAEDKILDRLIISAAVCAGIAVAWLASGSTTLAQFLNCWAILIAWCFALIGASVFVLRIFKNPIVSSAIVVTIAMAWLSWPIWLGPHLPGKSVAFLTAAHPLLSINGVLSNLGIWSERPLAYRYLINLGQDVPYNLPRNIFAMVVVHLLIGAVGISLGRRGTAT